MSDAQPTGWIGDRLGRSVSTLAMSGVYPRSVYPGSAPSPTITNLRRMLERASSYRVDVVEGRWVIETRHRGRAWEVIVEPDWEGQLLVVVTAYPVWE